MKKSTSSQNHDGASSSSFNTIDDETTNRPQSCVLSVSDSSQKLISSTESSYIQVFSSSKTNTHVNKKRRDAVGNKLRNMLNSGKDNRSSLINDGYYTNKLSEVTCKNGFLRFCKSIILHAGNKTLFDRCSLFLVEDDPIRLPEKNLKVILFDLRSTEELKIGTRQKLPSSFRRTKESKYQNKSTKTLSSSEFCESYAPTVTVKNDSEIQIDNGDTFDVPWGKGFVGYCALYGENVNVIDAYKDKRFFKNIDGQTGYKTSSVLCSPLKDSSEKIIGVIEMINKINPKTNSFMSFTQEDEKDLSHLSVWCSLAHSRYKEHKDLKYERKKVALFKKLNEVLHNEFDGIEVLTAEVIKAVSTLVPCSQYSVFLSDFYSPSTFSHVFNFQDKSQGFLENRALDKITLKKEGEHLNILCDLAIKSFNLKKITFLRPPSGSNITFGDNIKVRSMVSIPIVKVSGEVVGVLQCTNRKKGNVFTKHDLELIKICTGYLNLIITNLQIREDNEKYDARQRVLLEILSYHSNYSERLQYPDQFSNIPNCQQLGIDSWNFDDSLLSDDQTLYAAFNMFTSFNLLNIFHIEEKILFNYLATVKNHYRKVTYHNWRHSLNVAQCLYMLFQYSDIRDCFTDSEILGTLIAALSHDIDHRGLNNGFYLKIGSPLATLYSTSIMESHHFDQCIMVLFMKGCEILKNIDQQDVSFIIYTIENAILSTDLAVYIKKRMDFFNFIDKYPQFNKVWKDSQPKTELMKSMMMSFSDLIGLARPWKVQLRTAELIAEEFFEQGDIEHSCYKLTPIELMDRNEVRKLPNMQVDFIDAMVMPLYKNFHKLFPFLSRPKELLESNREKWLSLIGNYEYQINL